MPNGLESWLVHVPGWAMVLFRLTGIFIFAPVLGSRMVPARTKIFLAVGLSFCVYPVLVGQGRLLAEVEQAGLSLWRLAGTVGTELLIGAVIGYGASLPLIGIQLGGQVMDQQIGLSLAGVLNPDFDEQTGVVSELYFMLALAVFVILGGHRVLVATLVGSFSSVPLGGFRADSGLVDLAVGLMGVMMSLALRVAGPLLCLIFLETVVMGFLAKTVPQLNILSMGFPLRILIGMGLLIGLVGVTTGVFSEVLQGTLRQMIEFFTG